MIRSQNSQACENVRKAVWGRRWCDLFAPQGMSQNPFEPGQPERSPKEQEDFLKAISALPEVTKPQEVLFKSVYGANQGACSEYPVRVAGFGRADVRKNQSVDVHMTTQICFVPKVDSYWGHVILVYVYLSVVGVRHEGHFWWGLR